MIGIGTLINTAAIIAGGICGHVFGKFMTEDTQEALTNLSLVGSILIFCVGLNLVWGKKIRVANLLPAIVIAVIMAFLPFEL